MAAITSLKIQNFRIFDQEGSTFDLAPLTFLTGCNSSGKSSMTKALLLLYNFIDRLRTQGQNFDIRSESLGLHKYNLKLGDFTSVLNHNEKNDGCIHFTYTCNSKGFIRKTSKPLEVEYVFGNDSNDSSNDAWLKIVRITTSGNTILELDFTKLPKGGDNPYKSVLTENITTFNPSYLFEDYITWVKKGHRPCPAPEKNIHRPTISYDKKKHLPFLQKHIQSGIIHYCPILLLIGDVAKSEVRNLLDEQIKTDSEIDLIINDFEKSDFLTFNEYYKDLELQPNAHVHTSLLNDELLLEIHQFSTLRHISQIALDGDFLDKEKALESLLRNKDFAKKYAHKIVNKKQTINFQFVAYKLMQLSYRQNDLALSAILQCPSLGEDYSYAKLTNPFYDWFIMYVMDIIEHTLLPKCPINQPKQCHYISSDTCTVQRLYTLENLSDKFGNILQEYTYSIKNSYYMVNNAKEEFLNKWLQKFDIAHHIKLESVNDGLGITLRLYKSEEDNTGQLLADMGFGITQLVSVLLSIVTHGALVCEEGSCPPYTIIAIEEPENHLHPAYQSLLADMFYDAWKQLGVMFLIETHSEYLIRKTQVIVAEAYAGNEAERESCEYYVPPFDNPFKVYYIPKNDKPYEMIYRKDGNFENDFGTGFYDEATNLAFQTL